MMKHCKAFCYGRCHQHCLVHKHAVQVTVKKKETHTEVIEAMEEIFEYLVLRSKKL